MFIVSIITIYKWISGSYQQYLRPGELALTPTNTVHRDAHGEVSSLESLVPDLAVTHSRIDTSKEGMIGEQRFELRRFDPSALKSHLTLTIQSFREVVASHRNPLDTGADSNPIAVQVELEVVLETHPFSETIGPLALLHSNIVN